MKKSALLTITAIFTLLVFFGSLIFSKDVDTKELNRAIERLSNQSIFGLGGMGITGKVSQSTFDFIDLYELGNPKDNFENLLNKAQTQEAKCFALFGLNLVSHSDFEEHSKKFHAANKIIQTQSGCIVDLVGSAAWLDALKTQATRKIVKQQIEDWKKRRPEQPEISHEHITP